MVDFDQLLGAGLDNLAYKWKSRVGPGRLGENVIESKILQNAEGNDRPVPISAASLDSVLCTDELRRRPSRAPDYKKENAALVALSSALAETPRNIFQTLVNTILESTQSDSAGLSLLSTDDGGKRFYWPAVAGKWNSHSGGGTPRDFSPCGDVLNRDTPLLFRHLERHYTYFQAVQPPVEEALLVPFYFEGKAVGTLWTIVHDGRRKFDAEDERIMSSVGKFASSAYQTLASLDALKVEITQREIAEDALLLSNNKLGELVEKRTSALRRLAISLLRSQDDERRRFARNLHDSIGQHLALLKMNLDSMNGNGKRPSRPELLSECLVSVGECLRETRTISYLLHPPLLDEAGFEAAARWYVDGFAERCGIQAKLNLPPKMNRLPGAVELALFRVLQESLTNVHRHSESPSVDIELEVLTEMVILEVRDAGRGIAAEVLERFRETGAAGIGLAGMRERIADLGGQLKIESDKNGTLLIASIPLSPYQTTGALT